MKILILDDARPRRKQLAESLQKKRHEVTACYSSNDFIASLEKGGIELVLLDLESWYRGSPVYSYFGIAKKLENVPILFYNSVVNFSFLNDRPRHAKDRILFKPTDADTIISNVQDNR